VVPPPASGGTTTMTVHAIADTGDEIDRVVLTRTRSA
jgi:hypothetical protein